MRSLILKSMVWLGLTIGSQPLVGAVLEDESLDRKDAACFSQCNVEFAKDSAECSMPLASQICDSRADMMLSECQSECKHVIDALPRLVTSIDFNTFED